MSFFRSYLRSAAGRTCIIGSTVVIAAHLAPNTIWLDKWEAFWAFRVHGKQVPVPPKIYEKFKQVLHDLKIPPNVQQLTRVFNVDGFDLFHAGTPDGRLGGIIIGVPTHFSYDNITAFHDKLIVVRQQQVDWERRDAQRLLETTLLPDAAQKFAMASHLLRVQMGEIYYHTFGVGAAIIVQPILYEWAKNKFKLCKANLQKRMFLMVATVVVVLYLSQLYVDAVTCIIDKAVDTTLAEVGLEYIEGGREYYEKQIGRNLALRSLLEQEAEYFYTPEGNNKFFVRYRTLPVTKRKQFFEDKWKALSPMLTRV